MEIVKWLVWFYAMGTAIMASWLIYIMVTKLDRFDWEYEKGHIWLEYILGILLWPIQLIFKPKTLFDSNIRFTGTHTFFDDIAIPNSASRIRKLHELIESPPPCGDIISLEYHDNTHTADSISEILFYRDDAYSLLCRKLYLIHSDPALQAAKSWLQNRDPHQDVSTEVPEILNFIEVAFTLIESGQCRIRCMMCDKIYDATELVREVPPIHIGWNEEAYQCPHGHEVLRHNYMHLQMRKD